MEVRKEGSTLVIDSMGVYHIAENKRMAVACYRDMIVLDSIRCTQGRMIEMLEAEVSGKEAEIRRLTTLLDKATAKAQRMSRNRITYALIGVAVGVATYIIVFE